MKEMVYGYIRVSTKEQNEARQIHAMLDFGIAAENMVIEKQSGKDFQRPCYRELVGRLRPGDVLVVKSIDRLGRDYAEVMEQWRVLTRERGVSIVVLDMPLLDTRCQRDLTGTLIADIVLNLLSYVAQTEREMIRRRQAEGIAAARARGVRFGRCEKPLPDGFAEVVGLWRARRISCEEALRRLGVSRSYFYKHVKRLAL